MNKEESLALFERGKDAWNEWAARMLEERKALEEAGTWTASRYEFEWNYKTKGWYGSAAADFSMHVFESETDFADFVFPGRAGFGGATFEGGPRFGGATFKGDTKFEGTKFEGGGWFGGATFEGNAGFSEATFEGNAEFSEATFEGNAEFSEATFEGNAEFIEATFEGNAEFSEATFEGNAEFMWAAFSGYAGFEKAAFSDNAWFNWAAFSGHARFDEAAFSGHAGFSEAAFSRFAGFNKTAFSGHARFLQAVFEGFTQFDGGGFEQAADFRAIECKSAFSLAGATFRAVPDFIQAQFAEAPRFDDSDIESRRFWRPTLATVKNYFKGDRDLSARWRALKRLAVQGHDHARELEFFKNEVRTRGWLTGRHAFVVALFGLFYDGFSDFGRSILRPLCWWAASGVLFWWLYLGVHLGLAKQPFTAAGWAFDRIIQALGGVAAPQLQCIAGLQGHPSEAAGWLSLRKGLLLFGQGSGAELEPLHACLYRDVTQQSERFFDDLPGSVIGLGIAQHLVSAILLFLFLLAIRNHFRIK